MAADTEQLTSTFWKELASDRVVMLGLAGFDDGHARPMSALLEEEGRGPIWFFTSNDNALWKQLGGTSSRAICTFASKGNELFACIHGALQVHTDREMVERLWNPFVAAWYEGKEDPKLALLRLDPDRGEIWDNASSLLAGIKMLFGVDPKRDYDDKVAKVDLG